MRINRQPQRILLYGRGFSTDLRLKGAELDPSSYCMKILGDLCRHVANEVSRFRVWTSLVD